MAKIPQFYEPTLFYLLNFNQIPIKYIYVYLEEIVLFFENKYFKDVNEIFKKNNIPRNMVQDLNLLLIDSKEKGKKPEIIINLLEEFKEIGILPVQIYDSINMLVFVMPAKYRDTVLDKLKAS